MEAGQPHHCCFHATHYDGVGSWWLATRFEGVAVAPEVSPPLADLAHGVVCWGPMATIAAAVATSPALLLFLLVLVGMLRVLWWREADPTAILVGLGFEGQQSLGQTEGMVGGWAVVLSRRLKCVAWAAVPIVVLWTHVARSSLWCEEGTTNPGVRIGCTWCVLKRGEVGEVGEVEVMRAGGVMKVGVMIEEAMTVEVIIPVPHQTTEITEEAVLTEGEGEKKSSPSISK
ncbi:hypothetical protein E2C01_051362 [Portunus trituberculatus]|uniref:Uncharacterized protein n=1 Tax=Portunus trituberculatus TaxID=210409 RepID=A0A5B7GIW0_PORTR|nr:hypothetical protein [Portunus trituberculatus]